MSLTPKAVKILSHPISTNLGLQQSARRAKRAIPTAKRANLKWHETLLEARTQALLDDAPLKVSNWRRSGMIGLHITAKLVFAHRACVTIFTTTPGKIADSQRLGANEAALSGDADAIKRLAGSVIESIAETQELIVFCVARKIKSNIELAVVKNIDKAYSRDMNSFLVRSWLAKITARCGTRSAGATACCWPSCVLCRLRKVPGLRIILSLDSYISHGGAYKTIFFRDQI